VTLTQPSKPERRERPPLEPRSERRARQLLSILEAARRLSVSEATIRRLIREGKLEPVEVSPRRVALLEDELADFVDGQIAKRESDREAGIRRLAAPQWPSTKAKIAAE